MHQPGDEEVVTLAVPGYRQVRNYSCGYTAVLMVLRHFGSQVAGDKLFAALGTTRDGTGQSAIIKVLRDQGLRAGVRYDIGFADVQRSISLGKVLIGYLADEHHWVVLYGYGDNPQRVFVADPEPGKVCEYVWQSYGERLGGFAIVCSPRKDSVLATPSQPVSDEVSSSHQEDRSAAEASEQLSFGFGESQ